MQHASCIAPRWRERGTARILALDRPQSSRTRPNASRRGLREAGAREGDSGARKAMAMRLRLRRGRRARDGDRIDPVTGLLSEAAFAKALEIELERSRRHERST